MEIKDATIELSIKLDPEKLLRTGDMLTKIGIALSTPYESPLPNEVSAPPTPPADDGVDLVGTIKDSPVTDTGPMTLSRVPGQPSPSTSDPGSTGAVVTGNPIDTSPPTPPAPPKDIELDKEGLPWDKRIHAGTKTKCKTGEWKLKRGVAEAIVAAVKRELRERYPFPSDTPPVTDGKPEADINTAFLDLMNVVTGLITPPADGSPAKVSKDVLTAIAVKHGAEGLPQLLAGPIERINAVRAEVDALCLTLS